MKRWQLLVTVAILGMLASCSGGPRVASTQPEAPLLPEGPTVQAIEPIVAEDRTRVVVRADYPLSYTSYLSDPGTLVVEFPNADGSLLPSPEMPVGSPDLDTIRIERYEDAFGGQTTRLAFIGTAGFRHDIHTEGNNLWVEIMGPQRVADASQEGNAFEFEEPLAGSIEEELALEGESSAEFEEFQIEEYEPLEEDSGFGFNEPALEVVGEAEVLPSLVPQESAEPAPAAVETEPAPPSLQPRLPAATVLNRVEVVREGDAPRVRIEGDGSFEYESFVLSNPARLVVDLPLVTNRFSQPRLSVSSPVLKAVRIAQFKGGPEPVARVVFDLAQSSPYKVLPAASGLEVSFGDLPEVAAVSPAQQAQAIEPEPEAPDLVLAPAEPELAEESELEDLGFEAPAAEQVASSDMAPLPVPYDEEGEPEPQEETDLWPDTSGDEAAELPDDYLDEEAEFIPFEEEPAANEPPAAPEASGSRPAPQPSKITDIRMTSTAFEAKTIAGESQTYTGKRISISFRDADLKDVFRLFHEISGLNIVLDPSVAGRITIILENVAWDQALDIILKNNGLDKVFEDNLIRIATTQKLAQEAAARKALKEAQELEVDPITFTRVLSYAKVEELLPVLKKMLSKRGDAIGDKRTNSLIITEVPNKKEGINRLIDTLDTQTPQVMIEARIIETDRDFEQSFGINWGFTATASPALGTQTGLQFPHSATAVYDVSLPAPAATSTLGLTFGNVLDSFTLDVTLQAFELNGSVRILSAPKIATQNNETAVIEQGVQIPVVNTTATEINVEFISASLKLEVTPQITADDTIILDVRIENSSPDFVNRIGDTPPIITERAETKILIKNGGTAVIGGIYKLNDSVSEVGVPGLRRLPLLGWLFKSKSVVRDNSELLVFLTPRIL
ncbi:MAG: type IV pilus secretin PilQ [Acidobacteriota bacterium]